MYGGGIQGLDYLDVGRYRGFTPGRAVVEAYVRQDLRGRHANWTPLEIRLIAKGLTGRYLDEIAEANATPRVASRRRPRPQ